MLNKQVDDIENFDFGFSFTDEAETSKSQVQNLSADLNTHKNQVEELQNRLQKLYDAIVPFLDNLSKDPHKPDIHWPDRAEKIQAYKKKLQQIVKGK